VSAISPSCITVPILFIIQLLRASHQVEIMAYNK
jgi:hypothetical protein